MTMIRITVVNHARIEIACPPADIWRMLLADYGEGQGFARAGYRIDPVDDPSAPLGSYHMHFETADLLDERICHVTERDAEAMRLSLHANYLAGYAKDMAVYATYQAIPIDGGSLYSLDCHSTIDHGVEDGASREEIANSVDALRDQFQQGLESGFAKIKAFLEEQAAKAG
jgi:hypothetical protein